jgi:GH15 family glucan-1,4-alpha-glucosidase
MLRALCHGPTGALAAAGTTSLPEYLGGTRNWDYRYCWPRDAALAAAALLRIGNTGTAMRLLDWLLGVIDRCESPDRLRPIYTVTGSDLGPEAEIGSLAGYAESRPVRIGNAAAQQVQLDVFGPITDLVASLAESGAAVSPDHWRITRAMVQAVEARWQEPDHGIWEIRGPRRHHVHSKVMCFHTVDRATVVQEFVVGKPNPAWIALRERIREDVLAHGFNEFAGAFTAEYGSKELDAASLQVGLVGLVDPEDDRFRRTVDAVDHELRRGPTVYRYLYNDGLPGREGGFHLCTAWLIESLVKLGRLPEAVRLFDELVSLVGPTGLLSEQYDPDIQMPLGNAPQAYSHLSIINCAVLLAAHGHRTA